MNKLLLLGAFVLVGCKDCCFGCPPVTTIETDVWTHDAGAPRLTCEDSEREPNDEFPMADDSKVDPCKTGQLSGVLGGDDVDVHRVRGKRCSMTSEPSLHREAPEVGDSVRACLFIQCAIGATGLDACTQGRAMHMKNGLLGCCTSDFRLPVDAGVDAGELPEPSPDDAVLQMKCSNGKPEVNAYIVVDGTYDECVPYDLTYTL